MAMAEARGEGSARRRFVMESGIRAVSISSVLFIIHAHVPKSKVDMFTLFFDTRLARVVCSSLS